MDTPNNARGLTLVELIITVAITAILLAVGVPSFRSLIANSTITSEVNSLVSQLQLARSEAIKRGDVTILCATSDGESCSRSIDWHHGFMSFIDTNRNRDFDDGEKILAIHRPEEERIKINSSRSNYGRKTISYYPSGMAYGSTATFTFCDSAGIGTSKAVIVSNTGRPRVSLKRSDGSEIICN